jgi:hypothetical protein
MGRLVPLSLYPRSTSEYRCNLESGRAVATRISIFETGMEKKNGTDVAVSHENSSFFLLVPARWLLIGLSH